MTSRAVSARDHVQDVMPQRTSVVRVIGWTSARSRAPRALVWAVRLAAEALARLLRYGPGRGGVAVSAVSAEWLTEHETASRKHPLDAAGG